MASIISGASRPEHIPQNVELMNAPIPVDLWAEFKAEGLLPQDIPTPA